MSKSIVIEIGAVIVGVLIALSIFIAPFARNASVLYNRKMIEQDPLTKLMRDKMPGRILFDPPAAMKQGRKERVTVRISKNALEDLKKDIPPDRNTTIDKIDVLPFMTVKLSGGDAFQVESLEKKEDQFVGADRFTDWNYDVTPSKSGEQELDLAVGVRIKLPTGGEEVRFYPLYERKVKVSVSVWYSTTHFVSDHWEWIAGTVLIPLLVWAWNNRKKKTEYVDL
jgi:hypothetical protein